MIGGSFAPSCPPEWVGDWRLVEYDPHTNVSEWYLYDDSRKAITIRRIQHDIDALFDANQAELNAQLGARWGDGKKVASIPPIFFEKLGLDDAVQNRDRAFIAKVLNDPDNAKFRTFKGRI